LDYFASRSDEARRDVELFLSDRAAWEREGREQRKQLLALSFADFAEQWSHGKSPVDVEALHGEFGVWLHRAVRGALAPGDAGWTEDDIAIFRSPWGFDPASIAIPVKIWHGLDDQFARIEHGQWLAETIPGAQAELRDGDGHLGVAASRIDEVHEWLAQHL
jgi:pimeloyl-ACP methyl ester carboxylesterase